MTLHIESYAQKGHEFINHVANRMKLDDIDRAGRITRGILRALRNCLTHEESFQLVAQLPMAIKAVYLDGWKFQAKPSRIKTMQGFCDEVLKQDGSLAGKDFGNEQEVLEAIDAVVKTLVLYVSPGEIDDVIAVFPTELKILLSESVISQ